MMLFRITFVFRVCFSFFRRKGDYGVYSMRSLLLILWFWKLAG